MDSMTFNAVVLPLYATLILPNLIRNRKSGEYIGFSNIKVGLHLVFLVVLESYMFIFNHGFGFTTVLRIFGITALPIIGAFVFVKYSHKSMYGGEFSRNKNKGSS